jgi:hypothetical protein
MKRQFSNVHGVQKPTGDTSLEREYLPGTNQKLVSDFYTDSEPRI